MLIATLQWWERTAACSYPTGAGLCPRPSTLHGTHAHQAAPNIRHPSVNSLCPPRIAGGGSTDRKPSRGRRLRRRRRQASSDENRIYGFGSQATCSHGFRGEVATSTWLSARWQHVRCRLQPLAEQSHRRNVACCAGWRRRRKCSDDGVPAVQTGTMMWRQIYTFAQAAMLNCLAPVKVPASQLVEPYVPSKGVVKRQQVWTPR